MSNQFVLLGCDLIFCMKKSIYISKGPYGEIRCLFCSVYLTLIVFTCCTQCFSELRMDFRLLKPTPIRQEGKEASGRVKRLLLFWKTLFINSYSPGCLSAISPREEKNTLWLSELSSDPPIRVPCYDKLLFSYFQLDTLLHGIVFLVHHNETLTFILLLLQG